MGPNSRLWQGGVGGSEFVHFRFGRVPSIGWSVAPGVARRRRTVPGCVATTPHPQQGQVNLVFWGKKNEDANKPGATPPAAGPSTPAPAGGTPPSGEAGFSPEKALRFFTHAKTVHETENFEYAVQSWLNGLRWDPSSLSGLEGFFGSMDGWLAKSGNKAVGKEVYRSVSGKGDVDRYLYALLEWGHRPAEVMLGVRVLEQAAKLRLTEPGTWVGVRVLAAALRDKKTRKDVLLKIAECFSTLGAYDRAVHAAEAALNMDRTDGQLQAYIRELAAQATMTRGGYDKTGQAGGFRENIRDAQKQQQLEEADRISKTDETIDRLLLAAKTELESRPGDLPTIEKYCKLLLERGRPQDEERAHVLYMRAHADSKAFRFREMAGDIRIRQARRKIQSLKKMLEGAPQEESGQRMLAQAQDEMARLELEEYKLRVEAYPSDLTRKFELGKRFFAVGEFNESITCLQEAQADPKNRVPALLMLGQSFLRIQWIDESIGTFRQALEMRDVMPETNLELRYWLMVALQTKGESDRDLDSVVEADKLASSIAVQQITYRDIRVRRDAIKKLLGDLRAAKGA